MQRYQRPLSKTALSASASALILASICAVPAFAADTPPTNQVSTVQEVIVTAEKKPEAVKDVPLSITAVPQAQLEKLNAVSFDDYIKLVPGLSVESQGPGAERLTLRGLNAGGVASTVAVYVDETPFGSSSGLVDGSVLAADFDPFDMNRIEVLRGPQGTLYGSNTEGGLLKYVTNAPSLSRYEGAIEAGADSVEHGSTGWDVKGMINVPLGDTLALRIDGYHYDLPGFIDNPFGEKDENKGTKNGGRAQLLWKPTDTFSVRLSAFAQDISLGGQNYEDVDPVTLKPLLGEYTNPHLIPQPEKFQYRDYNATVKWDIGFADLTSSTSYGEVNTFEVVDYSSVPTAPGSSFTYGDYIDLLVDPAFGVTPPTALPLSNIVDDDKFTQEVRLQSAKTDNGFEWLLGGYYTRESGVINQHLQVSDFGSDKPIAAIPDLEDPKITSTYREWAAFGDVTYHITPQWDVEAGGRYSDQTQHAGETITGLLVPGGLSITNTSTSDVATWLLGTKYHISDTTMIYGRFTSGYRPGGPNVIPPGAPASVPFTYGPDKNTSYEAGIKTSFDDGKVSLDADIFYIDWRNIQLAEDVNGYGVNGNGGKAQSEGFEWALTWVPVSGLTFTWNGADTNAALTTDAPLAPYISKGDSLPMVPKWSSAIDAEYDWTAWGDTRAFVGGTLAYQSSVSTDFDSLGNARERLPGFDTIDLRAGLELPARTRIEIWAKNVTDTRGFVSFGGSAVPGHLYGGGTSLSLIQPATIGITVSKKF